MARKTALALSADELADTESQHVYADSSSLLRALTPFSFGVLLALAAGGTVLTAHRAKRLGLLYTRSPSTDRALAIDPDDADVDNNLGWSLASSGRIRDAIPHFERALALNPPTRTRAGISPARAAPRSNGYPIENLTVTRFT